MSRLQFSPFRGKCLQGKSCQVPLCGLYVHLPLSNQNRGTAVWRPTGPQNVWGYWLGELFCVYAKAWYLWVQHVENGISHATLNRWMRNKWPWVISFMRKPLIDDRNRKRESFHCAYHVLFVALTHFPCLCCLYIFVCPDPGGGQWRGDVSPQPNHAHCGQAPSTAVALRACNITWPRHGMNSNPVVQQDLPCIYRSCNCGVWSLTLHILYYIIKHIILLFITGLI